MENPTHQSPQKLTMARPVASGGREDDDCHDVEAASHRTFQVHALKREDVSDGHHWITLFRVHKNANRINQLGHQLITVGGAPKKYSSVLAKRKWEGCMVINVSVIQPAMAEFDRPLINPEDNFRSQGLFTPTKTCSDALNST